VRRGYIAANSPLATRKGTIYRYGAEDHPAYPAVSYDKGLRLCGAAHVFPPGK
jgi:hypothetical protein